MTRPPELPEENGCWYSVVMDAASLPSPHALLLLAQLLALDTGDGIIVERDDDIDGVLLEQLEAAYCIERHRLTGGGGFHLMLRRQRATSILQSAQLPVDRQA